MILAPLHRDIHTWLRRIKKCVVSCDVSVGINDYPLSEGTVESIAVHHNANNYKNIYKGDNWYGILH
jgi:hypothetical protein